MNRMKFTGLIIMMLLSIIGIIWVQIVWIKKAVGIRNENFNTAVIGSLNNAANAIESSRKMNFFSNFLLGDPFSNNNFPGDETSYLSIGSYSSEPGNKFSVRITNRSYIGSSDTGKVKTVNKSFTFTGDTSIVSDSVTFIVAAPDESGKMSIVRRGAEGNTNSRAVHIRQNEFLDWVRKRSSEFQNMSDQMISEIFTWEKTLELDKKEIEYTLRQSLSFSGIQTPYEYAIIRDGIVQDGTYKKSGKMIF
jgi:hypothetical protein